MNARALVLPVLLLAACAAGPRHGLVEDGDGLRFADVPVPPGYTLQSLIDDQSAPPRSLVYKSSAATPPSEAELLAFFTAELPRHGWTDVSHDPEKGHITAWKPAVGQAPGVVVRVFTRTEFTASPETRAVVEEATGESVASHVARMITISRGPVESPYRPAPEAEAAPR
ncbi:MAG: hypothetical protein KF878_11055 [Planctomycetes bacterium]|nr:hypothetical protein [Planctomycetota bacterium]